MKQPALGDLPELLGFHLAMASLAMRRGFAVELGLPERQFAALNIIGANTGISQIDVANRLGNDRATTMEIVRRLEARGLVARRRSDDDKRRLELSLTERGSEMLDQVMKAVIDHDRTFTARFTARELASLVKALTRIHGLTK